MTAFVDPVILGKSIKNWRPAEIQAQELTPGHSELAEASQAQPWQEIPFGRASPGAAWQPLEFAAQEHSPAPETLLKTPQVEAAVAWARSWKPQELETIDSFYLVAGSIHPADNPEARRTALTFLEQAQKKAAELLRQAEIQASAIKNQAEVQAAEFIRQAESQAAQVTQQAYAEGIAAAQYETDGQLRTATSIVEEVNAWREGQLSQAEMMILRLVIEIAQSIFGEGLPLDPETLGQSFSRALAQSKTLGNLRVYVNPEDAAILSPHWSQRQTALSGQQIELIPSDIIKRGGCYVEGQYGAVDARVESQFQLVKDTLLSTLAASKSSDAYELQS